jgi:hypothetical protein
MIAAMATAVSAPSILRLASGAAGLVLGSTGAVGRLAMLVGLGPLEGVAVACAVVGGCAGATKAAALATTGDGTETAATGALLTGALWRPTE